MLLGFEGKLDKGQQETRVVDTHIRETLSSAAPCEAFFLEGASAVIVIRLDDQGFLLIRIIVVTCMENIIKWLFDSPAL